MKGRVMEGRVRKGASARMKGRMMNDEWREKGVSTFWGTKRDIDGVVSVVCV